MTATVYFFDSSALVKRYAAEKGTAWVETITRADSEKVTAIAQIEQSL